MSLKPKRLHLATQVSLIGLAAAVAASMSTVLVLQRTMEAELRQAYLEQSRTTASTIAGASIDALITEDGPLLQTVAAQVIKRDRRIRSIVIENESGVELAAAGAESSGEGLLQFTERLEYGGEEFGRVMITWSTAEFYAAIDRTARRGAISVGTILLFIALSLVVGLHRLVVAPLHEIVAFLRSVHADTSTPDLSVQHSPEMQYLADQAARIAELVDSEKRMRSQAVDDAERLRLLLNEMDHRVKNNLAAIVGLIQRGVPSARSSAELADKLIDRIMSISRTHEALARAGWTGVSLGEDLPRILESVGDGGDPRQVRFTGPGLTIPPNEALPLCMALSELMTNARKHGSLSVDGGHVDLAWTREVDGLRIVWKELGGPPAVAPGPEREVRAGLGLVRGLVEYQLGGSVEIDFGSDGFAATFRVPLPSASTEAESSA